LSPLPVQWSQIKLWPRSCSNFNKIVSLKQHLVRIGPATLYTTMAVGLPGRIEDGVFGTLLPPRFLDEAQHKGMVPRLVQRLAAAPFGQQLGDSPPRMPARQQIVLFVFRLSLRALGADAFGIP
jgi:hypothetical protein